MTNRLTTVTFKIVRFPLQWEPKKIAQGVRVVSDDEYQITVRHKQTKRDPREINENRTTFTAFIYAGYSAQ